MANDNPNPSDGSIAVDPSQAQVLLASNIASDDFLWVVRASVEELHKLFHEPVRWVASLANLPGWVDAVGGEPAPVPVLTNDFLMSVEPTDRIDPDGWVVIQGIGGTNQLTIVATRAAAIRSVLAMESLAETVARTLGRSADEAKRLSDEELMAAGTEPLAPFWNLVSHVPGDESRKKTLTVDVILALSRFYAHFEILDRDETREQRAKRTCSYLLGCVFDPEGEAKMYNSLDQETLDVEEGRGKEGARIELQAGVVPKGLYANIEGDTGEGGEAARDGGDPEDQECLCYSFNGTYLPPSRYKPGTGTNDGGMIKRWGVECTNYP